MKRLSLIPTLALAIASLFMLPSCSYEGRVIETRSFDLGGRHFIQKRLIMCDDPYETRVITYQVPF